MDKTVIKSPSYVFSTDLKAESHARVVLIATIPGIAVSIFFFGPGILINLIWGSLSAILFEATVLKFRNSEPVAGLKDFGTLLTATLLCISIPPYSPWWLITIGVFTCIIFGKYIYGGARRAIFNPVMISYAALLISFPTQMTSWQLPHNFSETPTFFMALKACFAPEYFDAKTMATPLDILRHNKALTMNELWTAYSQLGYWSGKGIEWISMTFLASGIWLIRKGLFTWHVPFSMLLSLALVSMLFYDYGSSTSGGSPLFHILSGGTILAAFFIITQPSSSPRSKIGKLIFGFSIGILIYVIRWQGTYPDGVAFSVLLMNFATPLIDHLTRPKYLINKDTA